MPPLRTASTVAKPMKTERTHEENQERAYIAASRRSDRSLEARIESARRASEIHKKRTGRGLRVTEQDVINEEMYEEEDDDLPSQYQRLTAHLATNSIVFNRKLHDYIATQSAVRNTFMQQQFPQGYQYPQAGPVFPQTMNPFMGHQMPSPAAHNQQPTMFNSSPQTFSPSTFQQPAQNYRQAPYPMPQRPHPNQRSASIATPQQMPNYLPPNQAGQDSAANLAQGNLHNRRMSLPPQIDTKSTRPSLSPSASSQNVQQQSRSPQAVSPSQVSPQSMSPHSVASPMQGFNLTSGPPSAHSTPTSHSGHATPMPYQFMPMNQSTSSQVLSMNPLSIALPPESQQFVGSALDPNDPSTAAFMAGSENLPQPFRGTYHSNPNVSPKSSRAWNANTSAASAGEPIKTSTGTDFAPPLDMSPTTSETLSPSAMFNNTMAFDNQSFSDFFQSADYAQSGQEDYDPSMFLTFSD